MPGSGKTVLAQEYAYTWSHVYKTVLWLNAESKDTLHADLRDVAQRMGLKPVQQSQTTTRPPKMEFLLKAFKGLDGGIGYTPSYQETTTARYDPPSDDLVMAYVHEKLRKNPGWLLILDNADDPKPIGDLREKIYPGTGGHVLITSRNPRWTGIANAAVALPDTLDQEQTVAFLKRLCYGDDKVIDAQEQQAMTSLANEVLGGLILALNQVATYVRDTPLMSFAKLRQEGIWRELRTTKSEEYNRKLAVAAVFRLIMDKVGERNPDAIKIAHIMAYLAPTEVPADLLWPNSSKALHTLEKLGVIRRGATANAFTMHRLQQEAIRGDLAGTYKGLLDKWIRKRDQEQTTLRQAFELLGQNWQYDYNKPSTYAQAGHLAPHLQALWQHVLRQRHNDKLAVAMLPMVNSLGGYLLEISSALDEAITLLEQAVKVGVQKLKSDSVALAILYNTLGNSYNKKSKYKKAINY
ncbi:MAG: hypothetical protein AAF471_08870, partial [Myxococcota bacterium]